jgi:hypothetical protein
MTLRKQLALGFRPERKDAYNAFTTQPRTVVIFKSLLTDDPGQKWDVRTHFKNAAPTDTAMVGPLRFRSLRVN